MSFSESLAHDVTVSDRSVRKDRPDVAGPVIVGSPCDTGRNVSRRLVANAPRVAPAMAVGLVPLGNPRGQLEGGNH